MKIDWEGISNPIIDTGSRLARRDPALYFYNDTFYLFHTAVEYKKFQYVFYLEVATSKNLIDWSVPKRVIKSSKGFSSPGNVFKAKGLFNLCIQTYPVPRFKQYASEQSRLWLIQSEDLMNWSEPQILKEQGAQVEWSKSQRQIDPFIIEHEHKYYCYYKTSGNIGALISNDLFYWEELSKDKPILSRNQLPDHASIENICIIKEKVDNTDFIMFFSPCRRERGVGVAKSIDLIHWEFIHYLNLPKFKWAASRPTAPSVIDLRAECGKWLMAFHADRGLPHGGALGLAWSKDLVNWEFPKENIPNLFSIFD